MTETTTNWQESQQIQGFSPSPNFGSRAENTPKMTEEMPEISFSEAKKIIDGYQDENFILLEYWQTRIHQLNVALLLLPAFPFAWYAFSDLILGMGLTSASYLLAYFLYIRAERFLEAKEIECYANIKENIYVYSESPKDPTVYKRKLHHKSMLEKAKNLTPIPVEVIDKYFGIGQHCNETWNDRWPARLIQEINEDRAKRHKRLEKDYPLLYRKYILKQEM